MSKSSSLRGFTIVELLIVIVVIAILAAISIVAYNGIWTRAKNTQVQNDIRQVSKLIELYNAEKGSYPSTGGFNNVYTDSNCYRPVDNDTSPGYKGVNWIPDLSSYTNSLPQSNLAGAGHHGSGTGGCYVYSSNGTEYILSAWNAKRDGPSTDTMYRRIGWREINNFPNNYFICNHAYIGGVNGVYDANIDYYKHSYTISNITGCNETPPTGA